MAKFHSQNCRLNTVEARIHPRILAHISFLPAILPQLLQAIGQNQVFSHYRSSVAQCREILRRIKAKSRSSPPRPYRLPIDRCSMSLSTILDQDYIMAGENVDDSRQVSWLSIQVHSDHCFDSMVVDSMES